MITTYHLNVNDLSMELLNSIKLAFKDKTVDITVSEADATDETEYLLSTKANREHLAQSIKEAEEGKVVVFTLEEFQDKYAKA